jgi:hypothetical protein
MVDMETNCAAPVRCQHCGLTLKNAAFGQSACWNTEACERRSAKKGTPSLRFTPAQRNAVCRASDGLPTLGTWLDRVRALDIPTLTEALDGIWCGESGRETLDLAGSKSMLCVGWHQGRVEWSYLS